jgi:hypothetical protein
MKEKSTKPVANKTDKGLKILGIMLLAIGGVLLAAALAFPEGEKEEQGFMQSAQKRQNEITHGSPQPQGDYQAIQEEQSNEQYEETLFLRAEYLLAAGIFFEVAGTILLAFYLIKRNNNRTAPSSHGGMS